MKAPLYMAAYSGGFYIASHLPGRFFTKLKNFNGVDHAYYTGSQDVVARFRLFDDFESPNTQQNLANYLSAYTDEPLTQSEMLDNIVTQLSKHTDISKLFQVKRAGKDKDNWFWSFGKIHGLENLAFADPAELKATNGNPVKI